MILPFALSLLLAPGAPLRPVDIRAVLVELTIDADMVTRACDTIESGGSTVIDAGACLMLSGGVEIPAEMAPQKGGPPIKWKVRAAMVQFSDGGSKLVRPPEEMMRRAFMRTYPEGQRGVILIEARERKSGATTCAFFAPRTVSRFDPAKCDRVVSADAMAGSPAGESRLALIWRNAVVATGDL